MSVFSLRRAVERLRNGLLDTVAVDRLTMEVDGLIGKFSRGVQTLEKGGSAHLCICGSYGQGKSHNLQGLHSRALSLGYAVSSVQLDLREVPFHQFPVVYQALMENLALPDGRSLVEAWQQWDGVEAGSFLETMPERFQVAFQVLRLSGRPSSQKNRTGKALLLRPKEAKSALERVLMGKEVTLPYFKRALQSCGMLQYDGKKLGCKGNALYVQMVEALARLLQKMGYKGLVLLFDEAESMVQGRIGSRLKSYAILQQFFESQAPVYAIFAFTESFFERLRLEDYANPALGFPRNYAEDWQNLDVFHLQDLSSLQWGILQDRLIQLYADAYQIDVAPHVLEIKQKQRVLLDKFQAQETRFKLKALLCQLDMETQNHFLSCRADS